jgi:hypothetical protein
MPQRSLCPVAAWCPSQPGRKLHGVPPRHARTQLPNCCRSSDCGVAPPIRRRLAVRQRWRCCARSHRPGGALLGEPFGARWAR